MSLSVTRTPSGQLNRDPTGVNGGRKGRWRSRVSGTVVVGETCEREGNGDGGDYDDDDSDSDRGGFGGGICMTAREDGRRELLTDLSVRAL